MPLFLLLLIVPVLEIALFIEVGDWIGLWPTIAIVIGTAVLGTMALRSQGAGAMRDLQGSMAGGGDPGKALASGAMILVAGVLLLTPGFFTDAVGFALLTPPVRAAIIAWAAKRMTGSVHVKGFGGGGGGGFSGGFSGGFGPGAGQGGDPARRAGPPPSGPHNPGRVHPGDDVSDAEWEEVDPADPPRPAGARPSGWTRPPEG